MILWLTPFFIPCYTRPSKEANAPFDDRLYPGDIFHPDYQLEFFIYISSSASCDGVAAAAREVAIRMQRAWL